MFKRVTVFILIFILPTIAGSTQVVSQTEKIGSTVHTIVMTIVMGIVGMTIGGLLTYFFSTRNLEDKMKKSANEQIDVHKQIDHQESHWDAINIHKKECGNKIEDSYKEVSVKVEKLEKAQVRTNIILSTMDGTLRSIAKKMNIIQLPPPPQVDIQDVDIIGD